MVVGYSDGTLRVFSIFRIAMEFKMRFYLVALIVIVFFVDGEG